MSDDASPENLRKFLESDDPALVRMGLSMAKGAGVEITVKDLERFLKSDDVETVKMGFTFAEEAGVGDEAMAMLCEPLRDNDENVRWFAMETLREVGDARAVEKAVDTGIEILEKWWDLERDGWIFGCRAVSALAVFDDSRIIDSLIHHAAWACWQDEYEFPTDHDAGNTIHDFLEACTSASSPFHLPNPNIPLVPKYSSALLESMMDEILLRTEPEELEGITPERLDNGFNGWVVLQDIERNSPGLIAKTVLEGRVLNMADVQSFHQETGGQYCVEEFNLYSWILDSVGWKPDTDELRALYLITKRDWKSLVKLGEPAVDPLIRVLSGVDSGRVAWTIQGGASKALGKIGDARAVEPLTKLLDSSNLFNHDKDIRAAAKEALKKLGHEVE